MIGLFFLYTCLSPGGGFLGFAISGGLGLVDWLTLYRACSRVFYWGGWFAWPVPGSHVRIICPCFVTRGRISCFPRPQVDMTGLFLVGVFCRRGGGFLCHRASWVGMIGVFHCRGGGDSFVPGSHGRIRYTCCYWPGRGGFPVSPGLMSGYGKLIFDTRICRQRVDFCVFRPHG